MAKKVKARPKVKPKVAPKKKAKGPAAKPVVVPIEKNVLHDDPPHPPPADPVPAPRNKSVQVVKLDFSMPGFVELVARYDEGEPTFSNFGILADGFHVVGRNVLTQDEVDALVGKLDDLQSQVDAFKSGQPADVVALSARLDAANTEINTLKAEGTGRRVAYDLLVRDLADANARLARANNPAIGVAHPASTDDLPKLGDLPPLGG